MSFKDELEAYARSHRELNRHGHGVLERLADQAKHGVAEAFALVAERDWHFLLDDCIEAERRRRLYLGPPSFAIPAEVEEIRAKLGAVRRFLERIEDDGAKNDCFAYLGQLVDFQADTDRRAARMWPRDPRAARSWAVGWLAEGVEHLTGRPNHKHVAVLASAVLDDDTIDIDTVRDAPRIRGLSVFRR
jgi:hypothetical protein